jgi:hypothetical protein
MTSHVARLYALALALLVFFMTWAAVAAKPWARSATTPDPRLAALAAREQRLRQESVAVRRIVQHRWAVYRTKQHARQVAAAAPPAVRVVNLPPLTITRTS